MFWLSFCCLVLVWCASAGCGTSRVETARADGAAAVALRDSLLASSSNESAADAGPKGTGWATLKGVFGFEGTVPSPKSLVVDKDTEVCSKDGMKLFDRSLLVDNSSQGLANVVVFVRKSSRVKNPVSEEKVLFDQKNCEFLAPVFASRVGQPIDVKNSDPVGHNTNIAGTSFNQLIPSGEATSFTPNRETGMPVMVTCNIHPWMKAYAVFREDGYVAVSAADGSFTIPDLPAGEPLEFQVWHERSAGPNGALALDQPELKWSSKGRFKLTLQENEVRDLGTLVVPSSALGM
ncbi:MAG: hypothetical protein ABGW78_14600 [Pirellulales bacterium]